MSRRRRLGLNILIVSQCIPDPKSGVGSRNYYLLRSLSGSHSVSLLSLGDYSEKETDSEAKHLVDTYEVVTLPKPRHKRRKQITGVLRGRPYIVAAHSLPA